VNDVQVQQALQDMQELLLNGKREEACQKALENELWAPALLLSSYMNIDMYQKVMGEFARRSFKVGTPLRTLYMQFAGQGKHLFDMDTLEPLLDAWQANLSMLLNNRTPGDADVLVNIGEGLWKLRKDVEAAHVCMMLAGEEIQAADAPTCRMALIGADHRANPASFCTAAALQRTEIWEFAVKLKTPKKEMPVAMTYKLHYAMMLAEFGSKEKALAYVEALSVAMQGSARVPPRLQAEIEMFEHRLRLYIGGKTAAASSAFKGSFFGGLKKVLDTAVSSAIYGTSSGAVPGGIQATAKAPAIAPAPPAQAPSEKVKAIQAAAAEKERQAKLKAQQELYGALFRARSRLTSVRKTHFTSTRNCSAGSKRAKSTRYALCASIMCAAAAPASSVSCSDTCWPWRWSWGVLVHMFIADRRERLLWNQTPLHQHHRKNARN
jgi:hypothetical protein